MMGAPSRPIGAYLAVALTSGVVGPSPTTLTASVPVLGVGGGNAVDVVRDRGWVAGIGFGVVDGRHNRHLARSTPLDVRIRDRVAEVLLGLEVRVSDGLLRNHGVRTALRAAC